MGKTLILSDIHFCDNNGSVPSFEALQPLWQGCDTLILNGDTASTLSSKLAAPSIKKTEQLVDAANKDSVKTILLGGNHDPDISIVNHVYLLNENVLVFHGHAAFKGVAPWSWRAPHIERKRAEYIESFGDGFELQLEAVRNASCQVRSQEFENCKPAAIRLMMFAFPAAFNILHGWLTFPDLVSSWVESYSPQSKFIITGHTHRVGIWQRCNRTIINTGCFGLRGYPAHPRAIVVDGNTLSMMKLRKRKKVYTFDSQIASFEVL